MFERWWNKRQDEAWEAALTAREKSERTQRSPIWGSAFKNDAELAWYAAIDAVIAEWEKPWREADGKTFIERLRAMRKKEA